MTALIEGNDFPYVKGTLGTLPSSGSSRSRTKPFASHSGIATLTRQLGEHGDAFGMVAQQALGQGFAVLQALGNQLEHNRCRQHASAHPRRKALTSAGQMRHSGPLRVACYGVGVGL